MINRIENHLAKLTVKVLTPHREEKGCTDLSWMPAQAKGTAKAGLHGQPQSHAITVSFEKFLDHSQNLIKKIMWCIK